MLNKGPLFHKSCFLGCLSAVIIKMKNDIKEKQGPRSGIYKRSSDVNGEPTYRNDDKAIWYNKLGSWMIGDLKRLGSIKGGIYAKNNFGGLTDEKNIWKYWMDNGWKTAGTNDIIIECTSGTSKLFKNFFTYKCDEFLDMKFWRNWRLFSNAS